MTRFAKQASVVLAALVAAFVIVNVGQGLWGVMAAVNLKLSPAIPWAALVMPIVLFGLAAVLAGRGWPRWGAASRRALVPLGPVSREAWTWSLAAGVAGVFALAGLWTVLGSLVRVAPNVLPDPRGVPVWTAVPMLLVAIAAAPITEEIAFRGYAMGLLRRQFGPISAIFISSLMFAAAHLNHGLYPTKLAVYLLFGLSMAATAWRTGSLLPGMVVHSLGDLVFFTTVWPHDAGRRLVSEGGADAGFYAALALTAVGAVLWYVAFRRLLRATAPASAADVASQPAISVGRRAMRRPTPTILWTAPFAVVVTGLVSGVWGGLLMANLATSPAIPWAAPVMAALIWVLWSWLGGRWAPRATQGARRRLLRGGKLAHAVAAWAIAAGVLWVVALAGFWVVLHRLVAAPGNPLADFSKLPPVTVAVSLVMAAVSGAVSEEAGFRGYFQGALERRGLGAFAVLAAALVMAPIHASTQGFAWPTLLFYLLVDGMLGTLAYVTGSIRPGIVVHAIGLFVFFAFIWPADAHRTLIWAGGADASFWISLAQTVVFAALGAWAFVRLTKLTPLQREAAQRAACA